MALGSFPYCLQVRGVALGGGLQGPCAPRRVLPLAIPPMASLAGPVPARTHGPTPHCPASLPACTQMDDWRVAVGCANGTVNVVDLRAVRGEAGRGATGCMAHTVLPVHRERVRGQGALKH